MDLNAIPKPDPQVLLREELSGWSVLFHVETAEALALNATGAALWRLIDGQRTVADLVAALAAEFEDAPAETTGDVIILLADLTRQHFIEWQP